MATIAPEVESPSDRRRAARFQPAFGTVCRFHPRGEEGTRSIGLVWNISETGLSMLLANPPARGTNLDAELTTESGVARLSVKMQVVHVRKMPHGDYFLGAHFEQPLTSDELHRFLAAQITPKGRRPAQPQPPA